MQVHLVMKILLFKWNKGSASRAIEMYCTAVFSFRLLSGNYNKNV